MVVLSLSLLSSVYCLLLVTIFISQVRAEDVLFKQNYRYYCDNSKGNYTDDSSYGRNLNTLLSMLTSYTEIDYGFYNFTYGKGTDKVNAIGLCRGDVNPSDCRSCLFISGAKLTELCPNQKEVIGWSEDEKCRLRYSNRSIFGSLETSPAYYAWNVHNATQVNQFNRVLKDLLDSLRSKAVLGDSRRKYAAASVSGPNNITIYGLVQCTPDLSVTDCDNCLLQSIKEVPKCCDSTIGARIVRPSCNLRYETSSLFYGPPAAYAPSPPPTMSPSSIVTNNTSSQGTCVGTSCGPVFLIHLIS